MYIKKERLSEKFKLLDVEEKVERRFKKNHNKRKRYKKR